MEIGETAMYVSMGFIPTLLALEASWKLATRKRLGAKPARIPRVAKVGIL